MILGKSTLKRGDSNFTDCSIIKVPPDIRKRVSKVVNVINSLWNKLFLGMVEIVINDKMLQTIPIMKSG